VSDSAFLNCGLHGGKQDFLPGPAPAQLPELLHQGFVPGVLGGRELEIQTDGNFGGEDG
jgi:hypothetical protein